MFVVRSKLGKVSLVEVKLGRSSGLEKRGVQKVTDSKSVGFLLSMINNMIIMYDTNYDKTTYDEPMINKNM